MDAAPPIRKVIAQNMVRLRAEIGWSQEDLAAEARVTKMTILDLECERRNVTLDTLARIAQNLGVSLSALLTAPKNHAPRTNPNRIKRRIP